MRALMRVKSERDALAKQLAARDQHRTSRGRCGVDAMSDNTKSSSTTKRPNGWPTFFPTPTDGTQVSGEELEAAVHRLLEATATVKRLEQQERES